MSELHFIIAALTIICVFLATRLGKAHKKNDEFKLKIMELERQQLAVKMSELFLEGTSTKSKLSKTSESLLVLAIKSNNSNEASAAAVQACKRIHKELGYK